MLYAYHHIWRYVYNQYSIGSKYIPLISQGFQGFGGNFHRASIKHQILFSNKWEVLQTAQLCKIILRSENFDTQFKIRPAKTAHLSINFLSVAVYCQYLHLLQHQKSIIKSPWIKKVRQPQSSHIKRKLRLSPNNLTV